MYPATPSSFVINSEASCSETAEYTRVWGTTTSITRGANHLNTFLSRIFVGQGMPDADSGAPGDIFFSCFPIEHIYVKISTGWEQWVIPLHTGKEKGLRHPMGLDLYLWTHSANGIQWCTYYGFHTDKRRYGQHGLSSAPRAIITRTMIRYNQGISDELFHPIQVAQSQQRLKPLTTFNAGLVIQTRSQRQLAQQEPSTVQSSSQWQHQPSTTSNTDQENCTRLLRESWQHQLSPVSDSIQGSRSERSIISITAPFRNKPPTVKLSTSPPDNGMDIDSPKPYQNSILPKPQYVIDGLRRHPNILVGSRAGIEFPVSARIIEWACGIKTVLPWAKWHNNKGVSRYIFFSST